MTTTTAKERRYRLEITATQAQALITALDFYARLGMAQFDEIKRHASYEMKREVWDRGDCVDHLCAALKASLCPELGPSAYHGIMSPKIPALNRVCMDIRDVIRYRLAWDHEPKGGHIVDFDTPFHHQHDVALPAIEEIKNG